jgi:hypothetical protein
MDSIEDCHFFTFYDDATWNFGKHNPNFVSMPAKIGSAT